MPSTTKRPPSSPIVASAFGPAKIARLGGEATPGNNEAVHETPVTNAKPEEEVFDEETAKVIDMAVDAARFAVKPDPDQPAEMHPEEGFADESTDEAAGTVVKKVVVMTQDGEVIKTTETIEEQSVKKTKKDRKEFTAKEKLKILSELNVPNPPSVSSLLAKYGVSKSSLHRWRQPEKMERLEEMANGSDSIGVATPDAGGNRKRDMNDKLRKIKLGLEAFCKENLKLDENEQFAITSSLIQLKATEIKDELLKRHKSMPNFLTDEEFTAIQAFKGSKSWSCLIGNQLGYLSSSAGSIKWSDRAKANTEAYLKENARTPRRPKKQRMEFTTQEKLMILKELEDTNAQNKSDGTPLLTVEQICQKYHTSKSSLHRWKQQYKSGRLEELAETGSGFCHSKRVFFDKLYVIKKALNDFYLANEAAPLEKRVVMNYTVLQARAILEKEVLLEKHHMALMVSQTQPSQQHEEGEAGPQTEVESGGDTEQEQQVKRDETWGSEGAQQTNAALNGAQKTQGNGSEVGESEQKSWDSSESSDDILTKEAVHALENFKASNSWLRETGKKFGWKLDMEGKKDSVMGVGIVDGMVATATHVQTTTAYHHQDHQHHGVEHPVMDHPSLDHHAMVQEHSGVEHDAHDHAEAGEEGDLGTVLEQQQQQIHLQNGVGDDGHHIHNENQQQQNPQNVEHLAHNIAVYDAQGNVIADMLGDPLVHVEDNDVGGIVAHTVDV
eukprot:CAMPEP_0183729066 /NCGR_PEP_ID=MMETSP0737-20130205/29646_1 /TAXON_ID=385413 /ORGANISM="Thalassiosira miniscula, Strain CCMP1093" /LENGTH=724 /DNA_ID=CAMNT_0025961171 /DNA_START=95 /DNA_END=2269 /DNA_ORIENTATION=+